jgi:hypothetical protein
MTKGVNVLENRLPAVALAALAAAGAVPIALAQLDFAGVFNAFNIDAGDSPTGLRVLAGVSGVGTIAVIMLAFAGVGLILAEAPAGRKALAVSAVAGFVTATIFWIPAGIMIGAAAMLLSPESAQTSTP